MSDNIQAVTGLVWAVMIFTVGIYLMWQLHGCLEQDRAIKDKIVSVCIDRCSPHPVEMKGDGCFCRKDLFKPEVTNANKD